MHSLEKGTPDQQYPKSGSERPLGLTRRKHGMGLRDLGDREWFAPVGDPSQRWFVPLGTADEAKRLKDFVSQTGKNAIFRSICQGDLVKPLEDALNVFGDACQHFSVK